MERENDTRKGVGVMNAVGLTRDIRQNGVRIVIYQQKVFHTAPQPVIIVVVGAMAVKNT